MVVCFNSYKLSNNEFFKAILYNLSVSRENEWLYTFP